jgi:DNA-binding Lrp family transcriptional regulator
MTTALLPASITDATNTRILSVSEDQLQGFQRYPFDEVARRSGVPVAVVVERVRAMVEAGTIRRVRQTLMATNLASGALVAWQVPESRLESAFDFMVREDPFSGHVVIRTADPATAGATYRLWTTVKVPQGYSVERHAEALARETGAMSFRIMPARRLFALGVGHTRRRELEPGSKSDSPADVKDTEIVELDALEWRVVTALKRELLPAEIVPEVWAARAAEAGLTLEEFCTVAERLDARGVLGRFSTFLEHVKPLADGQRVTLYNALFHWAVPPGREIETGREVGRFDIITHAYWREGGPEFRDVNIMAVCHGMEKERVLAHKLAIDAHLRSAGIPVAYTNVFWGGRSEIKPSEISPLIYREWCLSKGLDPAAMLVAPFNGS